MQTINITEAKARFSEVVDKAINGENVIVTRMGRPVVKITRYEPAKTRQRTGHFHGKIEILDNFDEWTEEEARALGVID